MTVTLLSLRTQAKQRADLENSQFVTDAEWNTMINASIAELHDLLISAYDGEYKIVEGSVFQTANNVSSYALPSDFYKLRGVDAAITGNEYASLRPFNFNERNRNDSFSSWALMSGPSIRYRLLGSNIVFSPAPDAAYNIKLWYIPVATKLNLDTDTLDDLNQFSEYVVIDAAIKAMIKQELDPTALAMQKQAMGSRITTMAQNRDAGQPESVSDIYAENNDYYWYRGT